MDCIKETIENNYPMEVRQLQKLYGYSSENFLVTSTDKKFIYKQYTYSKELVTNTKLINDLLLYLHQKTNYSFPLPIKSNNNLDLITLNHGEQRLIGRMLTYIEGDILAKQHLNATILQSVGSLLAQLDNQLINYPADMMLNTQNPWHLAQYHLNLSCLPLISSSHDRQIISNILMQFEKTYHESISQLRHSIIHNDANQDNIIFYNHITPSLIDFDDLSYAPLVYDLAVCLSCILIISDEPLQDIAIIIKQYHLEQPLFTNEITYLYDLIAMRLCVSICQSEHDKTIHPDNKYIYSPQSMQKKLRALHYWVSLDPRFVKHFFLETVANAFLSSNN